MDLLPQNPQCYRELALLSLMAGKFDEASSYASKALLYDPKNSESHFTVALVQHIKQDYFAAENSYQQAQIPGENNSLLIANFVQNVWIGEGNCDKIVRYCQQMLRTSPDDYRYYYWIGRAYQLTLQISTAQQWLEDAYAGLIHSRLGKFSDGEAAMNKAMQLDNSSAEIMYRNADLYSIQRNKQKAFAALDKALRQQYDFAEVLNPDLSFISLEPEFRTTITRKIEGKWPMK
jgi:tetratricopeptide (TPR) repeat protein